jgi:hypothetical protein
MIFLRLTHGFPHRQPVVHSHPLPSLVFCFYSGQGRGCRGKIHSAASARSDIGILTQYKKNLNVKAGLSPRRNTETPLAAVGEPLIDMAPRTKPNTRPNDNDDGESSNSTRIHLFYRVFFLYVEPFFSLLGALYAGIYPKTYLNLTDPRSTLLSDSDVLPVGAHVALRQLANLYLLFAVNEALVLRATEDLRVWRTLLLGLLLADLGHLYSLLPLEAGVFWEVHRWNKMDWGNVAFVYLGAATRISYLAGLGITARATRRGRPKKTLK